MTSSLRQRLSGTPEPMHAWINSSGMRLCGDSWGQPGQPTVLLLHGGGQTRHAWRHTGQQLGRCGFHAIALDARGHGDSDWAPDADYSEDAMASDLVDVLAALGAHQPVLLGASMGGLTSLVALGTGRLDAQALILADVAHRTAEAGFQRVRNFMTEQHNGFASLEEAAQSVARYRGGPVRTRLDGLAKNLRQSPDGRLHWHWDPRFVAARKAPAERIERLAECTRQITQPVLLVRGARSDVVTEEQAREFQSLCPQAELAVLPNAGHMLTGDDNQAFGHLAEAFIRRHLHPEHR